jgi:hypothetical protein
LIARLARSGKQEEVVFPGVVEDHGCFLFLRNDATSGWDGFDNKKNAVKMTRVVKVVWERSKQLSSLSLSALTPIRMLRIRKKDGWRAGWSSRQLPPCTYCSGDWRKALAKDNPFFLCIPTPSVEIKEK